MRATLIAAMGALASCQSYELLPVDPKAVRAVHETQSVVGRQAPRRIMLVLDRSNSMKTRPDSDAEWGCCSKADCSDYTAAGDCKWNVLKDLLSRPGGFLDAVRGQARLGLAVFPEPGADTCSPGKVAVRLTEQAGATAEAIRAKLEEPSMAPRGGTPSAATLQTVAQDPAFMDAADESPRFAVLVTDGLPNCNRDLNAAACDCTSSSCVGAPESCLDGDRLASAVAELKARGVETFVIGFGSALANDLARRVLDRAADAGGRAQTGAATRFYQASSAEDLERVLEQVRVAIQDCAFAVKSAPSAGDFFEVRALDRTSDVERVLRAGVDWTFPCQSAPAECARDADCGSPGSCWLLPGRCEHRCTITRSRVLIEGDWCTALQQAEPNRYSLSFTAVGPIEMASSNSRTVLR